MWREIQSLTLELGISDAQLLHLARMVAQEAALVSCDFLTWEEQHELLVTLLEIQDARMPAAA